MLRWQALVMTIQFACKLLSRLPWIASIMELDRFLIRSTDPVTVSDKPPAKRAKPKPKQGKVSAKQRAVSHPRYFYCSGSKLVMFENRLGDQIT